jgi:NADH:ubiquinone oxidoreductase subunit K
MALMPQSNAEERFRAVSAQVLPFLTMLIAAASILSFVTLVGLAIIKQLFRYYPLQK